MLLSGLAAQAATKYQINVGGVEVTSDNASYITGGDISSGYASYNASTSTLTLHSIQISRNSGSGDYAVHNRDCSGLTIRCEGTCRLTTVTAHTIHMDKKTEIEVASGGVLYVKMTGATSSSTAALYSKNNSDIDLTGPGRIEIETTGSGSNYPRAIMGEGSNPDLLLRNINAEIKSAGNTIYNFYQVTIYGTSSETNCFDRVYLKTKNSNYNVFNAVSYLDCSSYFGVAAYPADWEITNGYLYDEDGNYMSELDVRNYFDCLPVNNTNFPDYNFRHWLQDYLNSHTSYSCGQQGFKLLALPFILELDCTGQNISSLKGIENFIYLDKLKCSSNSITSLDLSGNSVLTELRCYSNGMTYLNVNNCTNLTYLDCAPNNLTSLNLSNLSQLESLYCYSNRLTSLSLPASSSSALQKIYCYSNAFTSLSITGFPNLTYLDASNNTSLTTFYCNGNRLSTLRVTGCSALKDLRCYGSNNTFSTLDLTGSTGLTYLDCGPCPNLSSITNLSSCTGLKTFICYNSKLSDLSAVNNFSNLENLNCSNTNITSLTLNGKSKLASVTCNNCAYLTTADIYNNSALVSLSCYGCPALTKLYCYSNKLSTLNVTSNPVLKDLRCYGSNNTFNSLNLSGTHALTYLDCAPCPSLSSISYLGSCTALKTLICYNTSLTSLDVANLNNLESLNCNNSKITSLSLTNKSKLTSLACYNNPQMTTLTVTGTQISGMSMSGNTGLTTLNCYSNPYLYNISNLSSCTNLTSLDCHSCNFSSLDVSNLNKLTALACNNNKLTSLNVQGCTALKSLWCYQNQITGSDMTTLVNSLPTRSSSSRGSLYAVYNTNEGNSMTSAQITTAKNKYWTPWKFNGNNWLEMSATVAGDLNGDGQVTIADVTALIDLLLGGSTPPAEADINGDGQATISDVTALIDQLLGS